LSPFLAAFRRPVLGSNRYGAYVSLLNSITTLAFFYNTVNNKKWQAEHGNWVSQCARRNSARNWRGRSTVSEAEGVAEPSYKWKGCRELNPDLKVRSLAPSIRWTTSPFIWKALPDSNRHSELRRLCPGPVEWIALIQKTGAPM